MVSGVMELPKTTDNMVFKKPTCTMKMLIGRAEW